MSSKNILWVEAKDAEFQDVPALGEAIGELVCFDPQDTPWIRDIRKLDTFVHPVRTGNVEFYQGAAGEDSQDEYEQGLRIYCGPKAFAELFARHLTAGRLMLRYDERGCPGQCWLVEPDRFTRLDVL